MINKTIATAGILSVLLTAIHIFGGGADVHAPILASELDPLMKGYSSVLWHGVTASLALCSGILLLAAKREGERELLTWIVIIQFAAFAAIFAYYGITRFGTLFLMPQWIAFLIIIAVSYFGIQTHRNHVAN